MPRSRADAAHLHRRDPLLPLLKQLARSGEARLERVDGDGGDQYRVAMPDSAASRRGGFDGAVVREALAAGVLVADGVRYALSPAGRSRLRRTLAGGDGFAAQHRSVELRPRDDDGAAASRPVAVNVAESPLAWLSRRKDGSGKPLITAAQLAAGERLRGDFWFAEMTPRVTANWNALASSGGTPRGAPGHSSGLRDSVLTARTRVRQALETVGPELAGVLIDVCCHLKGLEEAERLEGWPQRSGKVVLQLALTRLARHYGLIGTATPAAKVAMTHWNDGGTAPGIDRWK